jgi:hypothetical protein
LAQKYSDWPEVKKEEFRRYHRERYRAQRLENPEAIRARKRAAIQKAREERPEIVKLQKKAWDQKYALSQKGRENKRKNDRLSRIKSYGLSPAEFETILESQGRRCAICGTSESRMKSTTQLSIDHCHATGKIRGLLCNRCNRTLARLGDTLEGAMRFVRYLQESEGQV